MYDKQQKERLVSPEMATSKIEVHPAAAIFPMMSDEELAELGESIKKNGLREKIQVIPMGAAGKDSPALLLDGRNRLEAIRRVMKLSDEEIIKTYVQGVALGKVSPEEYVVMANIERRNLTQAQRRDLAGKLAVMLAERQKDLPKEQKTDTTAEAAKMAGVSRRTAATAKKAAAGKPVQAAKKPDMPRPVNVIQQLEAARKTLTTKKHVAKWTTPQLREAYARAADIVAAMKKLDEGRTLPGDKIVV